MGVYLFSLRNVPEDEAEELRELLTRHGFEYYETTAGRWGIATPAIWLCDQSQRERAKALLAAYQAERARTQREDYERRKRSGEAPTLFQAIRRAPLRFLIYVGAAALVLYFSTRPFLGLLQ
jgi:hypothetical protein